MFDLAEIVRSLFDFFVRYDPANAQAYAVMSVAIVVALPVVVVGLGLWIAESRSLSGGSSK